MTPFKHNIRNLREAYPDASPVRRQMLHAAALANDTCQRNRNYPKALAHVVPHMKSAMEAAGVQPVEI
jgi:hypothetical protein